mmetsp:Transcript_48738/g.136357  ORF Transcript_48738/g.136357 Transcript_48738/m.136357 type:complete len:283 (+) Transcript_48738:931-1779(+)
MPAGGESRSRTDDAVSWFLTMPRAGFDVSTGTSLSSGSSIKMQIAHTPMRSNIVTTMAMPPAEEALAASVGDNNIQAELPLMTASPKLLKDVAFVSASNVPREAFWNNVATFVTPMLSTTFAVASVAWVRYGGRVRAAGSTSWVFPSAAKADGRGESVHDGAMFGSIVSSRFLLRSEGRRLSCCVNCTGRVWRSDTSSSARQELSPSAGHAAGGSCVGSCCATVAVATSTNAIELWARNSQTSNTRRFQRQPSKAATLPLFVAAAASTGRNMMGLVLGKAGI